MGDGVGMLSPSRLHAVHFGRVAPPGQYGAVTRSRGSGISPRASILRGVAPDAVAVGYSDGSRRWVTAAGATSADVAPLPYLDGVVVVGEAGLAAAADDFGHVVQRRPSAVRRPGRRQTSPPPSI